MRLLRSLADELLSDADAAHALHTMRHCFDRPDVEGADTMRDVLLDLVRHISTPGPQGPMAAAVLLAADVLVPCGGAYDDVPSLDLLTHGGGG